MYVPNDSFHSCKHNNTRHLQQWPQPRNRWQSKVVLEIIILLCWTNSVAIVYHHLLHYSLLQLILLRITTTTTTPTITTTTVYYCFVLEDKLRFFPIFFLPPIHLSTQQTSFSLFNYIYPIYILYKILQYIVLLQLSRLFSSFFSNPFFYILILLAPGLSSPIFCV